MIAVKANRRWLLFLLLLCAAGVGLSWALFASGRGTYHCGYCELNTPDADPGTSAFIRSIRSPVSRFPLVDYMAGTTYNICNADYCAQYQEQFDGSFYAAEKKARHRSTTPGKVTLIEPPPRQPPPRQLFPTRPPSPMPGPPGRTGCVTVGKKSNPCTTLPR